jgi:hypothetical protein
LLLAVCLAADAAADDKRHGLRKTDGKVDRHGPFLLARATGPYESVKLDVERPGWMQFRFKGDRGKRTTPRWMSFKRLNLTAADPAESFAIRMDRFRLHTPGAHNAKIMLGYMPTRWRFTHGDNGDLVHWADAPRVVLFLPVRHGHGGAADDDAGYRFSPYGGQAPSVVEFKAGELIEYAWYRDGPDKLAPQVLFDLSPHVLGDEPIRPGIDQPMFSFDVMADGKWRVRVERDGRDGLAGGPVADGWDMVFTEKSAGAKPYTVDLGDSVDKNTAFGLSVYCPSGGDRSPAEIDLTLSSYDRDDDGPLRPLPAAPWIKLPNVSVDQLPDLPGSTE